MLETTLDRMVRKSVEETLNAMLDAEADEIGRHALRAGCARSLAQKRSGPLPGRFQSVDCMVSPSRDMSR